MLSYSTFAGGTLDNTGGTVRAQTGGTVDLLAAALSNLSGTTLTGGSGTSGASQDGCKCGPWKGPPTQLSGAASHLDLFEHPASFSATG